MVLKNRASLRWLYSLFLMAIIFIPASEAWGTEFRSWYYQLIGKNQNSALARISYAILMTLITLVIVYFLYKYTPLFYIN
jgi:hypothetical protein